MYRLESLPTLFLKNLCYIAPVYPATLSEFLSPPYYDFGKGVSSPSYSCCVLEWLAWQTRHARLFAGRSSLVYASKKCLADFRGERPRLRFRSPSHHTTPTSDKFVQLEGFRGNAVEP